MTINFLFIIIFVMIMENSYKERIAKVIEYIYDNPDKEIRLDVLADIACFSSFHFHRIFTALVGETPRDYVERTRLERAANSVFLKPSKSLDTIATEFGYSSGATFSRAFKKHFNLSPTQFLKKHKHDFHDLEEFSHQPDSINASIYSKSDIVIKNIPEFTFIYFETMIGYGEGIPLAWKTLISYAKNHNLITNETQFAGTPFDNPGITPRNKCRYRACISVDRDYKSEAKNIGVITTQKSKCAVLHFKGETKDITDAYSFLYGEWLPPSGYEPNHSPILELYSQEMHLCQSKYLEYDIALPIVISETIKRNIPSI